MTRAGTPVSFVMAESELPERGTLLRIWMA